LIQSSCCSTTSGGKISHLTFIQLNKRLEHIEFDLNYVELILILVNKTTVHTTQFILLL